MIMDRRRDFDDRISYRNTDLIKVMTGRRRYGKSYLLFETFCHYIMEQGYPKKTESTMSLSIVDIT